MDKQVLSPGEEEGHGTWQNTGDLNTQVDTPCQGLPIGPMSHQLDLRAL